MKRILMLVFLLVLGLFTGSSPISAFAVGEDQSKTAKQYYEEFYSEKNGYMSVEKAVHIFESKYKKKVELPNVFPTKVIMQTAEIVKAPDQKGTAMYVYYLTEKSSDSLIFYVDHQPRKEQSLADIPLVLNDGTKARFRNHHLYYFLKFEKDGLMYTLGIPNTTKLDITPEVMRQIANSMSKKP